MGRIYFDVNAGEYKRRRKKNVEGNANIKNTAFLFVSNIT